MQWKKWMATNKVYIMGALTGALAGFLYWNYIGCLSGACAITSKPLNSTLYFSLLGMLVFGLFKKAPGNHPKD